MSVTERDIPLKDLNKATVYGRVSGDVTTITSVKYTNINGILGIKDGFMPTGLIIDGKLYNWIADEYSDYLGTKYIEKAHVNIGSGLTINKPIFKINNLYSSEEFSFYDVKGIGVLYGESTAIEVDGKTAAGVEIRKVSSDALYRITWKLGEKSYSIDKRLGGSSTLTASYIIPKEWNTEIHSEKVNGKVIAEVYYGSQKYEEQSCWITYQVPEDCKPEINSIAIADTRGRVPKEWAMFVQSNSNIAIGSISVTESYGSAIKKVELMIGEETYAGTMEELPVMPSIEDYGVIEITVKVTDGRGRTDEKSAKITVVEYKPPTLQVDSYRCGESGDIENEGLYFLATTNSTYSTCNGKNKATLTAQYKLTSEENYPDRKQELPVGQASAVCGGDLDTEYSYNVLYTISDAFNTIRVIDYVSTAVYAMHFLRGGRGIAFGMKATVENAADFGFNAIFRKGMTYVKEDGTEVTMDQILEALGL